MANCESNEKQNGRLERLKHPGIAGVVERNIKQIAAHRQAAENSRTVQERVADAITRISGSLAFVWLHVVWFGLWVAANLGLLGITPFDPYPFGLLTTVVSLEAIFLSTFVLVSQNRQAEIAERRAQLDLQINLLAEHEITRMLTILDALATHAGLPECNDREMKELENDVEPKALLDRLEEAQQAEKNPKRKAGKNGRGQSSGRGRRSKK